jgi:hypothetical protein
MSLAIAPRKRIRVAAERRAAAARASDRALDAFAAAWNTRSDQARRRYLRMALASDATFADPSVELTGMAALADYIARLRAAQPDSRWTLQSTRRTRCDVTILQWSWVRGAACLLEGCSCVSFDRDGRIRWVAAAFARF